MQVAGAGKARYLAAVLVEPSFRRRATRAGFTLVELMAVVVITGILATVGLIGFRKYVHSAKGAEAQAVIQAIRGAEEAYAAENHVYLNVSTTGGANNESGKNWFPNTTPDKTTWAWFIPPGHPDRLNWLALSPAVTRSVQFGYLANAGVAGTALTVLQNLTQPGFAVPTQNWYVIQAQGDTDGDGVTANYASTSMTGEIYSEREGE